MQTRAAIGVIVVSVITLSCGFVWNVTNRGGLESDIEQLFKERAAVEVSPLCTMVGRTRTGSCVMSASNQQVTALVQSLALTAIVHEADFERISPWEAEGGCTQNVRFSDRSSLRIYGSETRAFELQLSDDAAFEYLLLYHIPESGQLCVQISYAYG